ncbi:hypothetical protein HAINFHK1212_1552, partial [Haemophilus influenzae HK1212]
ITTGAQSEYESRRATEYALILYRDKLPKLHWLRH